MYEVYHYPKYYFCKRGESDLNNILTLLQKVPVEKQKTISASYENLFRSAGRSEANNWLRESVNAL